MHQKDFIVHVSLSLLDQRRSFLCTCYVEQRSRMHVMYNLISDMLGVWRLDLFERDSSRSSLWTVAFC